METEHDDTADRDQPCDKDTEKFDFKRIDTAVTRFIGDHPAACLVGAFVIGLVVARLTKGRA